jgi:hypothetical protein
LPHHPSPSPAPCTRHWQVFIGNCHGHIRNFVIKGMAGAATEKLKLLLEDDLSEFSSFERMSVDAMDLIRAAYKELHPGGAYAKGKGREFLAWSKEHFPKDMWMPMWRALPAAGRISPSTVPSRSSPTARSSWSSCAASWCRARRTTSRPSSIQRAAV